MHKHRTDRLGRALLTGEIQRRDGRYAYVYSHRDEKKSLYSWRLLPEDPLPEGKRWDKSLREKEEELHKEEERKYRSGSALTVAELAELYLHQRGGLSYNTRATYDSLLKIVRQEEFGNRPITEVRTLDAKLWLMELQSRGRSFSCLKSLKAILQPAFAMAVEEEMVEKNPFGFSPKKVLENDRKKREALSPEQEEEWLRFFRSDPEFAAFYDGIRILLGTGLRISEFCGLTLDDLDFEQGVFTVERQLIRSGGEYHITRPKTRSGIRTLPMTQEVRDSFLGLLNCRPRPRKEPSVEGVKGFLVLQGKDQPAAAAYWKQIFRKADRAFRERGGEAAADFPTVSPHICRHTYCTKMARMGMNPKVLQYLMGHSNISVTLDVYTHLQFEDAREEMKRIGVIPEEAKAE